MKRALIIFPDEWVAYSPTVLNLVEMLKRNYLVKVICFDLDIYNNSSLDKRIYKFIKINNLVYKVIRKLKLRTVYKIVLLWKNIRKENYDVVIGIDIIGVLAGQFIFKKCFYLSLEIYKSRWSNLIKSENIKALIIQTVERRQYLYKNKTCFPTIFMQNSPILNDNNYIHPIKNKVEDIKMVYIGNICEQHGVIQCIEAVSKMSNVKLYLKGIIDSNFEAKILSKYKGMINELRLIIDKNYIEQTEMKNFLSQFTIGFCLYDFNIIKKNDFNYISCPSGKLFNYYMAGVPVITSNIVGLNSVSRFETGIMIDTYDVNEIKKAIEKILLSYELYVNNCFKASQYYDFKVAYKKLECLLYKK